MPHRNIFLFSFSIILLFFASSVFAGLGISPSDWIEENALPGQQIIKTFTLSRSDAQEDLYFTSNIQGELTDWITIENGNNFTISKGEQQYPVGVILNVPKKAEKRQYQGEIRLNSVSKNDQEDNKGSVGVLLSALIRINLTVSDKLILDYTVLQIEVPQQEVKGTIDVILKIWNKGNVTAKPTKLTAEVFDKFNINQIDSKILTDFSKISGVAPFSEGKIKLEVPINLDIGQYWAKIAVYQDEQLLKSDDIIFDITKPGFFRQGTLARKIFGNNPVVLIIEGIILLVIIVAGFIISVRIFTRR